MLDRFSEEADDEWNELRARERERKKRKWVYIPGLFMALRKEVLSAYIVMDKRCSDNASEYTVWVRHRSKLTSTSLNTEESVLYFYQDKDAAENFLRMLYEQLKDRDE